MAKLDFVDSVTRLAREVVAGIPELAHIDLDRVLVSASFARRRRRASGVLAFVLPLRYRDGSPVETRVRGKCSYHFAMLPYHQDGREILYIIYFMLPRFLNLGWREKLETVIHELYHISPSFNGDLRRFPGRSSLHGNSLKEYDFRIREILKRYLDTRPNLSQHDVLFYNYLQVERRWEGLVAKRVKEPRPQLIKVANVSEVSS